MVVYLVTFTSPHFHRHPLPRPLDNAAQVVHFGVAGLKQCLRPWAAIAAAAVDDNRLVLGDLVQALVEFLKRNVDGARDMAAARGPSGVRTSINMCACFPSTKRDR